MCKSVNSAYVSKLLQVPSKHYLLIDLEHLLGPTEDYYTKIDKTIDVNLKLTQISSQGLRFDIFVIVR